MQLQTSTSIPANNLSGGPRSKPPSKRDADIIKELERLSGAEDIAYQQRSRFAMRRYLQQVYWLYWRWRRIEKAAARTHRAAALQGVTVRRGTHPLKILIDLTTPPNHTDPKARSRMARALEFAAVEGIRPRDLIEFLDQSGGIAGAAGKMVRWRPRRIRRTDW